jgi:hypothetical protein
MSPLVADTRSAKRSRRPSARGLDRAAAGQAAGWAVASASRHGSPSRNMATITRTK